MKHSGIINFDILDPSSPDYQEIIYAIANGYEYLKKVNLLTGEKNVIKISPFLESISGSDNSELMFEVILDRYILEEYRQTFTYFLDPDRISSTLNEQRKSETIDIQVYSDDGGTFWKRVKLILISTTDEGKPESYLATMSDITQQKLDEQKTFEALQVAFDSAQQANSAKSDFLSRMSHDIRTPMNAIIGMTSIAAASLDDKERLINCLDKINISSKHLMSLINEVLDMSRIESGRMILAEEKINLHDLIDNIVSIMQPQIESKGHNFELHISEISHPDIIGDSLRLQQCFLNFLNNAVKYTPDNGHISLHVSEREGEVADSAIFDFVFEDNGYGMAEDFVEHIFQPFTREEDSRISKIQGTGLGMAIAYNIVRLMDGNIDVVSEPDVGSRFTVTIKLKIDDFTSDNHEEEYPELISTDSYDFTGKKILLVEDNEINLEIAEELLTMAGAEVETAENGKIALDIVSATDLNHFDLIIMDIQMPVMNGYDATIAIRALDRSDVKTLPIFAMTANAFVEDVDMARNAGMQEHISKPLNIETLYEAIKRWV